MGSWAVPELSRVIGASHQRQGRPCQDAVLARELHDRHGECLQLMTVADGHGGARYHRSEVGSRLACEQVAAVISDHLTSCPLSDPAWETWLQQELPPLVQSRWLRAIETDWQEQPSAGEPFSALTYGTTLGVVLMSRHWWAAGGLGDWDLLAVPAQGPPALLNQEPELGGGSEATASLCLDQAPALWRQRCQLVMLDPDQSPLTLLLSSDGLRKSCATDEDYRVLGAYLCGFNGADGAVPDLEAGGEPADLEGALERITREGSGDDISVAIGRWIEEGQEAAEGTAGSNPDHSGRRRSQGRNERVPIPEPGSLRRRRPWSWLILVGLAGAIGVALWLRQRALVPTGADNGPTAVLPAIDRRGKAAVMLRINELCRLESEIRRATLRTRRETFEGLHAGRQDRRTLLRQAAQDPLGALIAWSQPEAQTLASPVKPRPAADLVADPKAKPAQGRAGTEAPPLVNSDGRIAGLAVCQPLAQDLRDGWSGLRPAQPLGPERPARPQRPR